MKIYDVFNYFNETDLLTIRFREHDPFVKFFVIVEGDHTFSGEPKPPHFQIDDPRWRPYRNKIVHLVAPLDRRPKSAWKNEFSQRDYFASILVPAPEDLILLSDVDEVVSRLHWGHLIEAMKDTEVLSLDFRFFNFFLNLEASLPWYSARLFRGRVLSQTGETPQKIRVGNYPISEARCGWHFSYLMSPALISEKIRAFSHQEYNFHKFTSIDHIRSAMAERRDLFNRPGITFTSFPVDSTWPLEVVENRERWSGLVCPVRLSDHLNRVKMKLVGAGRHLKRTLRRA